MSAVNIRNFVDVNIVRHKTSTISGTRETVVLFTDEARLNIDSEPVTEILDVDSLTLANSLFGGNPEVMPHTLDYCEVYFKNGGKKLKVYTNIASEDIDVSVLSNDYICIAFASSLTNQETDSANLLLLANSLKNKTGIEQKIIVTRTTSTNPLQATDSELNTILSGDVKNFAIKHSSVLGAEMTIAAYLSKVNVYTNNTIFDYMFTIEDIAEENISNIDYEKVIEYNMNVDIILANEVRNCGGNCSNGEDLINTYVLIILQQTLTDVSITTLASKLKNQSGLNVLYNSISAELEKYKDNGYLTTDKIWNYESLYKEWNGKEYLIIEKGTPLQSGYYVKILPYFGLSDDDKKDRKAPPIYVILAEQYGIRSIKIEGEAF